MLGRRNLLGLIMGGGASAVINPKVSLKEAASAIGVPIGAPIGDIVGVAEVTGTGPQDSLYDPFWASMDMMRAGRYAQNKPLREMPAHIATKRSWSPVFKAREHAREAMIFEAFEQKLRHDQKFRESVLGGLFGIGGRDAGQP